MKTVNILGTPYEIIYRKPNELDPKLQDANGYIEPWTKKIVLEDAESDDLTVNDFAAFKRKVMRHEIIHAFLHECGLRSCSWGDNEEIVDWIAHQIPQMVKAMQEAECL